MRLATSDEFLKFQRAGSRVAWIGKQRVAFFFTFGIQLIEKQQTAKEFRRVFQFLQEYFLLLVLAECCEWYAHLAVTSSPRTPVATGDGLLQFAIFITEADGCPVELQFANVFIRLVGEFADALVEIA